MCYHAKFGGSRSNGVSVRTKVRRKNRVPPFKSLEVTVTLMTFDKQ